MHERFQCCLPPNATVLGLTILFALSVALKGCLVVEFCIRMVLGTSSKNCSTHNTVGSHIHKLHAAKESWL